MSPTLTGCQRCRSTSSMRSMLCRGIQPVRALRGPDGLMGPSCQLKYSIKRGCDDTALARQHYGCHDNDPRCDPICRPTHVSSSCTLFGLWPCTSHLLIMKACRRCSSRARWRLVRVTHRVIGDTGVAVKQVLEP